MTEGTLKYIYNRGTRDARGQVWGRIELDNGDIIEFSQKHVDPELRKIEGLNKFTADKMKKWRGTTMVFEMVGAEGGEIAKGTLRRKG